MTATIVTVCNTEYDLSELDYYELNDLWLDFVGCADSLTEQSGSYDGVENSISYEQALEEYRVGIAAVQRRMEELEREAAKVAVSNHIIQTHQPEALLFAPCWWFGCEVLVEPDETHCEKHRLLSTDITFEAQQVA